MNPEKRRKIFDKIKESGYDLISKEWKTLLVFLIISTTYWILMRINENYQFNRTLIINYVTDQGELLPDTLFADTLQYRIQSKVWNVWRHSLPGKMEIPARYFYDNHQKEQYIKNFIARYNNKLDIKYLHRKNQTPYKTNIRLKKVPVKLQYQFIPENGYIIKKVRIEPDSIWIFGKKEIVDTVRSVSTPYKKFIGLKDKRLLTPSLILPPGVYSLNNKIRVKIYSPAYVSREETISIFIPDSLQNKIILFPSGVTVYYKQYPNKPAGKAKTWKISVNWEAVAQAEFLQPVILQKPENAFDIQIEPDKIDYLIKK